MKASELDSFKLEVRYFPIPCFLFPAPCSLMDLGSSYLLDEDLLEVILPYEQDLMVAGIDFLDERIQELMLAYPWNIEAAIQALIEAYRENRLDYPEQYLSHALAEGWKPLKDFKRSPWHPPSPVYPVYTAADIHRDIEPKIPSLETLNQMYKAGGTCKKIAVRFAKLAGYLVSDRGIEDVAF